MHRFIVVSLALLLATPAAANQAVGTWRTGTDKQGRVAHVLITPCGVRVCGRVAKTFDKSGKLVKGPNDGKRVIWDMVDQGGGSYRGKFYVPLYKTTVNGKMVVAGSKLTIKGCVGPICKSQKWTRVK